MPATDNGNTARLLPGEGEVKMRLYGQGLGDCFLLAFPRPAKPEDPCYVVIDCGVGMNTPDEQTRMVSIVQDIHTATGGTVDVLAVTHEHYDHVIGFLHAQKEWEKLDVKSVWVPWTEIEEDRDANTLRGIKQSFTQATVNALGQSLRFGADPEVVAALEIEAGFLGVDAMAALDPEAFAAGAGKIGQGYKIAKGLCAKEHLTYCEPGDVRRVPGTEVRTFVLGPPRFKTPGGKDIVKNSTPLVKLLVDEEEMYHYNDYGMTADGTQPAGGSGRTPFQMALESDPCQDALAQGMMGMDGTLSADEFNRFCPFDPDLRMEWDEALLQPFFWEHYTSSEEWRRVDGDWMGSAADLALRAGDLINNISLVLAFEMPQTKKVLLFVGDAQVGNWLSWDFIEAWTDKDSGSRLPEKPDMNDLLGRVAFYKVGHHGSHNATIKQKGLERMAKKEGQNTDLLAYIPVSVPVAHDILGYCPMPFYPVLRALYDKTGGRVFLANGELLEPPKSLSGELLEPPENADREKLWQGVTRATTFLPPKVTKNGVIEGEVPLYLEVTVKD